MPNVPASDTDQVLRVLRVPDTSGMPKYAVLTERLRAMILGGAVEPGSRLPNERDLAAAIAISLGTVQRALRTLVSEGYVVRRPKLGSFVAERKRIEQPWHCRFLTNDGRSVLPIEPRTLKREVVRTVGPWTEHLGPCSGGYLYIERCFEVAGEFVVTSRFWGDANRLAALRAGRRSSLDGENLKNLIAVKCQLPVTRVIHKLRQGIDGEPFGVTLIALAWSHQTPLYFQEFLIPSNNREMLMSDSTEGWA